MTTLDITKIELGRRAIAELRNRNIESTTSAEEEEEQQQQIPQQQVQKTPPSQQQQQQQQQQEGDQTYSYLQAKINNTVAQFQNDRIMEIARIARKDKHIIYKFKDAEPTPPKLGEKRDKSDYLEPIEAVYFELRNDIHEIFKTKRAKILDLQLIKLQMSTSVDKNGNVIPAVFTKNDITRTNIPDKVFYNINTEIENLETEITELQAKWYYGIDKELLPQLENTSLQMALEAGMYRERFGLVSTSKNSAVF